jgi:PEP-CTERM motif-containing protein
VSVRPLRLALLATVLAVLSSPLQAATIVIDFESLNEGDFVGGLLGPDVTFSNASILTAGSSLNELEFPPQSGTNVAVDTGGAMRLDFAAPISSFSAYFTYAAPLTLEFFDASSNSLGVVTSLFGENYVSTGNPTNELLSAAFAGTAFLTISGSPLGGSFLIDDVSFETTDVAPVPEPSTILLIGSGLAAWGYSKRRRRVPTES